MLLYIYACQLKHSNPSAALSGNLQLESSYKLQLTHEDSLFKEFFITCESHTLLISTSLLCFSHLKLLTKFWQFVQVLTDRIIIIFFIVTKIYNISFRTNINN